MKVSFTSVDTNYACEELGRALVDAIPAVTQVACEYAGKDDARTLVVVFTCPCCKGDHKLETENAVLVSPFRGIDCAGHDIHCVDKNPPFRTPGKDNEAHDLDEYLAAFRATIEKALA